MYFTPEGLYGNNVSLTYFRMEGQRTDGYSSPGADMECMVTFNAGESGCNITTGFCNPGAQIAWYVNGVLKQDTVWSGYNGGLGGYIATFRVIAPQSGTMTVTAVSANTVTFTIQVLDDFQDAGIVSVSNVYCGNRPYNNASCDGSNLIIYFYRTPVETGNGVAYVDIYMDGVLKVGKVPTSSSVAGYDSHTISCPSDNVSHTILVKGKNDSGASVVLPSGGNPCLTNPCGAGCPDQYKCGVCVNCGNICQEDHCAEGCTDYYLCGQCGNPPCGTCTDPPCGVGCPDYGTSICGGSVSSDIFTQITRFITEHPAESAVAGVIALMLIIPSKK